MGSIIAAIFSAAAKWVFSCFAVSHDERLGRAEATVEAQNKELKNVEIKNKIDNHIDGADAAWLRALRMRLIISAPAHTRRPSRIKSLNGNFVVKLLVTAPVHR